MRLALQRGLVMDVWRMVGRGCSTAPSGRSRPPPPEQSEAGAMPTEQHGGLPDGQGAVPGRRCCDQLSDHPPLRAREAGSPAGAVGLCRRQLQT